jgi:alpha-1,6-mannosyltransferase
LEAFFKQVLEVWGVDFCTKRVEHLPDNRTVAPCPSVSMHRSLLRVGFAMSFCYGALAIGHLSGLRAGAWWIALTTTAVILLAYLYCRGWFEFRPGVNDHKLVTGFALVFALLALLLPAFHSTDLYSYINLGWRQVRYGLNPYVHPTGDVPDPGHDPMITLIWLHNPCPYGFLFTGITRWIVAAGHGQLLLTIVVFQSMNLVLCGLVAWLIPATRKHIGSREDGSVLYLFLWSPMVILQLIADGHNDILMALAAMLAMYMAARDRWLLVIPLLTMGALIKYSIAVIIPFAVLEMIRRRRFASLIGGGAIAIGLILASAAPYLADYRHFQPSATAANLFSTANSFESVLFYPTEMVFKPFASLRGVLPTVHKALVGLIALLGLAVLIAQLVGYVRNWSGSLSYFVANALFAQLLVSCVLAIRFYPWYIAAFFPLALLLDESSRLRQLTIVISLTGLLIFTPLGQAHIINYLLMIGAPIAWFAWRQMAATEERISWEMLESSDAT